MDAIIKSILKHTEKTIIKQKKYIQETPESFGIKARSHSNSGSD